MTDEKREQVPKEIPNRKDPEKTYPPKDNESPNKNNPINPKTDE